MSVEGIDVSEFSLNIDWKKVKNNNISFAIARSNDGVNHIDRRFNDYWDAIKKAGIIRGAYFFFRPSQDILTQVKVFAQSVDLEVGDLPPVVDIESIPSWDDWCLSDRLQKTDTCLKAVEKACGCKPIIYTGPSFWREKMGDTSQFSDYDLWVAHYGTHSPDIPGGWKVYTFHQYAGDLVGFPGIDGDVDRNRFNGSLDRLQAETITSLPLKLGRIGPKVEKLQQALSRIAKISNCSSMDPGPADGIFGLATFAGVKVYQKANNSLADGVIASNDKLLADV